jgi:hypothetical protein
VTNPNPRFERSGGFGEVERGGDWRGFGFKMVGAGACELRLCVVSEDGRSGRGTLTSGAQRSVTEEELREMAGSVGLGLTA